MSRKKQTPILSPWEKLDLMKRMVKLLRQAGWEADLTQTAPPSDDEPVGEWHLSTDAPEKIGEEAHRVCLFEIWDEINERDS